VVVERSEAVVVVRLPSVTVLRWLWRVVRWASDDSAGRRPERVREVPRASVDSRREGAC
jgi:hypothetical protein